MNIALISEHASPLAPPGGVDSGGQNVYVAHVARQLARRGCAVDVFTRRDHPLSPEVLHWHPGVRVVSVPAGPPQALPKEALLPYMDEFGAWLLRFFRRQPRGYDLVHANFFMSGWAALQPARTLGLPLVMTFHALGHVRRRHQGPGDGFPEERLAIEARLLDEADRTIAECPDDRADMIGLYGADPARIEVVPCGFDPAEFGPMDRAEARAQLGWRARDFVVLQLGRLVPRKGVDNVIRAFGLARPALGSAARLCVVGGDAAGDAALATPEVGRLHAIARHAGVEDCVQFTGRRARGPLRLFYNAANVFVTTPWYEPFGITPLEAMACARPVIGSDVGGIRYSVRHGVTGFRVPPRSPEALAEQLVRLHRDPGLGRRLGAAGLRRVQRRFTWQRVAGDLHAVYQRVLRRGAATHDATALAALG